MAQSKIVVWHQKPGSKSLQKKKKKTIVKLSVLSNLCTLNCKDPSNSYDKI